MKKTNTRVEEFIRVDHAGERGAVKIYEGQLLALNTIVKNDSLKKRVEVLSDKIKCKNLYKCDVSLEPENENSIENLIKNIKKDIGDLDFIVHALAYSDKEELKGKYVETSRKNY